MGSTVVFIYLIWVERFLPSCMRRVKKVLKTLKPLHQTHLRRPLSIVNARGVQGQ